MKVFAVDIITTIVSQYDPVKQQNTANNNAADALVISVTGGVIGILMGVAGLSYFEFYLKSKSTQRILLLKRKFAILRKL